MGRNIPADLVISNWTAGVSNICLTCKTLLMLQVYFVKVPNGNASLRTNAVVALGSRFFFDPIEILSRRQSKKT